MCSFHSESFQDDIFNLDIKFRSFSKKLEIWFLQHISLLVERIPLFLPRSSHMVKPLLELCRVDPGDAFTYLSWSHIMFRSNFRIREKKCSIFHFYAYFLKGNFKELPEELFSAKRPTFFCSNFKNFSRVPIMNPRSFLISNRGRRTKFHYGFNVFGARSRKLPKVADRF